MATTKPGVQKPHCEALYSAKRSAGKGLHRLAVDAAPGKCGSPVQELVLKAGRKMQGWTLDLAEALL